MEPDPNMTIIVVSYVMSCCDSFSVVMIYSGQKVPESMQFS
jgi:hypothetical protein